MKSNEHVCLQVQRLHVRMCSGSSFPANLELLDRSQRVRRSLTRRVQGVFEPVQLSGEVAFMLLCYRSLCLSMDYELCIRTQDMIKAVTHRFLTKAVQRARAIAFVVKKR